MHMPLPFLPQAQSVDVPSGRTEPSSKSLDDLPPPPAPAAKGSGKQLFSQGYVAPHPGGVCTQGHPCMRLSGCTLCLCASSSWHASCNQHLPGCFTPSLLPLTVCAGIAPAPAVTAGAEEGEDRESFMEHPVYDLKYLESIKPCHRPPVDVSPSLSVHDLVHSLAMQPPCACPYSISFRDAQMHAQLLLAVCVTVVSKRTSERCLLIINYHMLYAGMAASWQRPHMHCNTT